MFSKNDRKIELNGGQEGKMAGGQEESDNYFELTTGNPPLNLPLPMTDVTEKVVKLN